MPVIYHLISRAIWESVKSTDEYRAESLETEGFIHCSQDQEQLLRVASRLYAGRDDLLALEVDTDRLASPLKREPSRSGEVYPHIYGPLNISAVVGVQSLALAADGRFSLLDRPTP